MMRGRRMALVGALVALGLTGGGLATAAQPPVAEASTPAVVEAPFTDIGPGDAYYDDVLWMAENGITTGWPDGTFRPTAPVTREAAAAFLARSLDSVFELDIPECPADLEPTFTDVDAGNPFCGQIEFLAEFAISGYPDGTFRPSAPITREAFTAILIRVFIPGETCDPAAPRTFTDVTAGHPFCGYIEAAAEADVVTGWPDGTFRPGLNIERQAVAAILHRFFGGPSTPATTLAGMWPSTD